ncbi:hypothetical protein CDAR_585161 [Caerostris darwini]|uniref:Uncharacterized protein n=1 Tax=Caerostris darwini TaxID=1538125 RepID=A0AAV4T6B1_9ARAC|nr:hypothetical protein CDAR_585161 [Caerostris darwini]
MKFAEIRSSTELPSVCASCFSEFPCPEEMRKITQSSLCNGSNEEWMKEVKHSCIALNRNDINNSESVSVVTIKFAEIRSPAELLPGCAS